LNAAFRRRVSATKLFNKPPLAILNGTSNPTGLHNEHSLFQRISIHLHYDVKASKRLASHLMTDWQRKWQAGCVAVSLRLDYLYLILSYLIFSFRVANFLFANSQNTTTLHYGYDLQMYCTFVPFVNQHFPGLPASGTHCI
jgi:hypothetical protein